MGEIHYFNPSCEMEVANKLPFYRPPKQVENLCHDGAFLPFLFADDKDFVIVDQRPSTKYTEAMQAIGFCLNNTLLKNSLPTSNFDSYLLSPWGWSPTIIENFKNWFTTHPQIPTWQNSNENWYRREQAIAVLEEMVHSAEFEDVAEKFPKISTSVDEVSKDLEERGAVVLKAPLSSSGRGVQFLRKPILNPSNKQWINSVISQQKSVITEHLFHRIADLSCHFRKVKKGPVQFMGTSNFMTNSNGKYKGNFIGTHFENNELEGPSYKALMVTAVDELVKAFNASETYKDFEGSFGVDMFFYGDGADIKLHPCVEINARKSMGYIALQLEKKLDNSAQGLFTVELKKDIKETDFFMEKKDGKILNCFWPLTDFWKAKQFVFMLKVG